MKDYQELYDELSVLKDQELVLAYEIINTLLMKRQKEKEFRQTFLERDWGSI